MSRTTAGDVPHDHAAEFAELITDFGHGAVNRSLTDSMRAVVAACVDTGRKGSLTIKIDVKPEGKTVGLSVNVKSNKPEHALPGEIFYGTEDGGLTREDPKQTRFGKVIDVGSGPRVVKEV
jgi:hypothetical protein